MARERLVMTTMIVLLLVLWAGFLVHRAPRFPGSLTGGMLAVSGALLMITFSIAYSAVKRVPWLRAKVTKRITMADLLTWHVYTGALGALLAILHTGHRFESNLGMALTASMLVATFSGYVGRHLLGRVSLELREKREMLIILQTSYNEAVEELARNPMPIPAPEESGGRTLLQRLRVIAQSTGSAPGAASVSVRAFRAAEAIADMEYSITSHDRLKRLSLQWLKLHIVAALVFYALLGFHVWAAIHFGLRWFQ